MVGHPNIQMYDPQHSLWSAYPKRECMLKIMQLGHFLTMHQMVIKWTVYQEQKKLTWLVVNDSNHIIFHIQLFSG